MGTGGGEEKDGEEARVVETALECLLLNGRLVIIVVAPRYNTVVVVHVFGPSNQLGTLWDFNRFAIR